MSTTQRSRARADLRLRCYAPSLFALASLACAGNEVVSFQRSERDLTLQRPALYPETIEYDAQHASFLVSSLREGAIYRVQDDGSVARLVDDPRLCSVLGIALDAARGRLWAVNSDLASSARPSAAGPKKLAAVGVYDVSTGKALDYIDLTGLATGDHLLNGIALDSAGNAYVTDSFSPTIYKIDAHGQASVFLQSPQFVGDGINLNGLVVHPDGYLLAIKKSDGSLFKVPLADPSHFSKVAIAERLIGGDGVSLIGKHALLVIANQTPAHAENAAFALSSQDGWASAKLSAIHKLGDVYPTTAVVRDDKIYVVHSKLNQLIAAPPEQKDGLRMQATIQQIGAISR